MQLFKKIIFLSLFPFSFCAAQQRIFLVGDAGELQNGKHPVCDWLKQHVNWNDSTNSIVYLGNNIYPGGMPEEGGETYEAAKTILDYQISLVQGKNGKAYFIPGNVDWKRGKTGGLSRVQNEWQYINKLALANVQMLPHNGCPGPVEVQIGNKVVLVFLDSQWWLQQTEKTGVESDCDFKSEEEITTALKDIFNSYPDKLILVAMHHPIHSYGREGGYKAAKEQYRNLVGQIEDLMKLHPNVIHASGHDHNLQFIQEDSISYIVSGAGSQTSSVNKGDHSLFAKSDNGFAMVEVSAAGNVMVKFYTLENNDLTQPAYSIALNTLPAATRDIAEVIKSFPDSVTVIGSGKFKSSGFRHFLLGKNYRREWRTELRVGVLNLGTTFGGLTPLRRGGGHQTKSLRLEDANGKQYVLRSIEKSVTDAALPPEFRGSALAKDLITEGVSASYPYAALSIPPLAEAANVPHSNPRLVFVPDDPRLGKFRSDFANTFSLLEERIPGNAKKVFSTDEMAEKLNDDNDNSIDQKELLRARLLDMFIMDFDRHEDQWIWSATDNGKGRTFHALPRDRDQPFFVSKGVLPSFSRWPWISPQVQGFRSKAINIKTYNFNGKNIDRAFLTEMNKEDWQKATDEFVSKMTDDLIEKSLELQPKEIRALPRNQEIIRKLKDRKNYFAGEMMEYYYFLSKIVNVMGSDKKELFDVTRNGDGSVLVQVFKVSKEGDQSKKMYDRTFDAGVTKELRLYGMGGDDKFLIHGEGNQIKIRMIGGVGNDVFESNASSGAGKNIVYDLSTEENRFEGKGNFRHKLSADPDVNKYERLYYKYNLTIPFLAFGFNPDDGLFLGGSLKLIRHGFRKVPYKTMHQFTVTHALATEAFNFRYNSEFIGVLGENTDIVFDADIKEPSTTTNFFGYGNNTVFVKTNPGKFRYYRARYAIGDISLGLRKNFSPSIHMTIGPMYEYFSLDSADNGTRFINNTFLNGLDPATLYEKQSFAGGKLLFEIDNRKNKSFSNRGIKWLTSLRVLTGLNDASHDLTDLKSDFSIYLPLSKGIVLATRFGGGHNFGDFEFFHAQYLGGTENLRGYRKYRFAGQTIAYNNIEMRFRLSNFTTYLFPGSFGFLVFHDVGRAWVENDTSSSKWHTGYGGGIWISPMNKLVITASYTSSKEDNLPLITVGWQF